MKRSTGAAVRTRSFGAACSGDRRQGVALGIIGIIAAIIAERYGKPCILLSTIEGETKGSGRSINGFSLYEALAACSGYSVELRRTTRRRGLP